MRESRFDAVIGQYREAFRRHGRSPGAVLCPKGRQDLRYTALTTAIGASGFSILDFGCGLAALKGFLDQRFEKFTYTGVDLVPEFVADCRIAHPGAKFLHIRDVTDVPGEFDYVVLSGVFNILYTPDRAQHLTLVLDTIERLFERTRVALACDFLSDQVDFQLPGAFHMGQDELLRQVQGRLSRRYVLDHSYMPYEFALTVFKDQRIERPANVFSSR